MTYAKSIRGAWLATSFAVAALAASVASSANAAQLDDIIKAGKIVVGVDLSAPPFGLQDENLKPAGLDVDVANMLAKDLGVTLEIVQVNSNTRIPYLATGKVDVDLAAVAITTDRAKAVAFSSPYSGVPVVLAARKDLSIAAPADLANLKIGVARGTTSEGLAVGIAPSSTQVVRFDDEASAQAAIAAGQVDAYVSAQVLTQFVAKKNPQLQLEDKFPLAWNYQAVALRRGDADFQRWLDVFVFIHRQNGDFAKSYEKWFGVKYPELGSL